MKFAGFIQALTSVVLSFVRNALTLVISLFLLCYLVGLDSQLCLMLWFGWKLVRLVLLKEDLILDELMCECRKQNSTRLCDDTHTHSLFSVRDPLHLQIHKVQRATANHSATVLVWHLPRRSDHPERECVFVHVCVCMKGCVSSYITAI